MIRTILFIAAGGGIGSVLRYFTTLTVQKYYRTEFPLATFITNVLGCFFIGLFMGWLQKNQWVESDIKWFFITGFCGGYTTFSAFSYENALLLENNQSGLALCYIGASVISGLMAVWLGLVLSR